jgi:hypothetical protein
MSVNMPNIGVFMLRIVKPRFIMLNVIIMSVVVLSVVDQARPKLVKFLSSSNDWELYCSYAQIIVPTSFAGQGVTVRMLKCLDGAT